MPGLRQARNWQSLDSNPGRVALSQGQPSHQEAFRGFVPGLLGFGQGGKGVGEGPSGPGEWAKEGQGGRRGGCWHSGLRAQQLPVLLLLEEAKRRLQWEDASEGWFFLNHLIMIKDLILSPSLAGSDSIWSLSARRRVPGTQAAHPRLCKAPPCLSRPLSPGPSPRQSCLAEREVQGWGWGAGGSSRPGFCQGSSQLFHSHQKALNQHLAAPGAVPLPTGSQECRQGLALNDIAERMGGHHRGDLMTTIGAGRPRWAGHSATLSYASSH